jgi:hypothetical protein
LITRIGEKRKTTDKLDWGIRTEEETIRKAGNQERKKQRRVIL